MKHELKRQLARLRTLGLSELREAHLDAFGEPTRSGNKDFLAKRIAWRLQSLAEGGLSERARQRAAELARDADLRVTVPRAPAFTDASATSKHQTAFTGGDGMPPPGSVLTRTYQGKDIVVTVLPKGFEYDGVVYRSLTAIARAVTGSHWNGRLFFGLGKANAKGGAA